MGMQNGVNAGENGQLGGSSNSGHSYYLPRDSTARCMPKRTESTNLSSRRLKAVPFIITKGSK